MFTGSNMTHPSPSTSQNPLRNLTELAHNGFMCQRIYVIGSKIWQRIKAKERNVIFYWRIFGQFQPQKLPKEFDLSCQRFPWVLKPHSNVGAEFEICNLSSLKCGLIWVFRSNPSIIHIISYYYDTPWCVF